MLRVAGRTHSRSVIRTNFVHTRRHLFILVTVSGESPLSSSTPTNNSSRSKSRHNVGPKSAYTARFYSSSTGKGTRQIQRDPEQPIPPLPSSKKTVDLKPPPRKSTNPPTTTSPTSDRTISSSKTTQSDTQPSSSSSRTSQPTKTNSPSQKHTSGPYLIEPSSPNDPGIIQTALNDINDALENGTLQPLPPDLRTDTQEKGKEARDDSKTVPASSPIFDGRTGRIWWHKFKEMTKFYFFGVVKLGREHRITAAEIKQRRKAVIGSSPSNSVQGDIAAWRDQEFLDTYKADLLRLVPFISIIVILEEILPLVIIYAPFLLPSTCKLPSQALRIDQYADQKRWGTLTELGRLLGVLSGQNSSSFASGFGEKSSLLNTLPDPAISLLCRLLNINPYGPTSFLRSRIRSKLQSLSKEDIYFTRNLASNVGVGSPSATEQLTMGELRTILSRRGIPNTSLTLQQLRQNLEWWLAQREDPTERRLQAVLELARASTRPTRPPTTRGGESH